MKRITLAMNELILRIDEQEVIGLGYLCFDLSEENGIAIILGEMDYYLTHGFEQEGSYYYGLMANTLQALVWLQKGKVGNGQSLEEFCRIRTLSTIYQWVNEHLTLLEDWKNTWLDEELQIRNLIDLSGGIEKEEEAIYTENFQLCAIPVQGKQKMYWIYYPKVYLGECCVDQLYVYEEEYLPFVQNLESIFQL